MAALPRPRCWACGQFIPGRPERDPLDHDEPAEEHFCPKGD